jgi:ribonucleoside-diphosphate reductase alpha chain
MTAREHLPNRRPHAVMEFEHAGIRYVAGIGRFADGRLAEIFLNTGKIGTSLDAVTRDSAIAASLALQFGCDPETLRHALTRDGNGSASGALGALLDKLTGTAPHD